MRYGGPAKSQLVLRQRFLLVVDLARMEWIYRYGALSPRSELGDESVLLLRVTAGDWRVLPN